MKSNEQIVRETGSVWESFSSNTKEITSANERTQDINARSRLTSPLRWTSLIFQLMPQDTIGKHLLEVDKAAREREEVILKQLEEKEPLPDKEVDQMAWVRAANQHRAIEEEIIFKELIYI